LEKSELDTQSKPCAWVSLLGDESPRTEPRDDKMVLVHTPVSGPPRGDPDAVSGTDLFRTLWAALSDLLGTAATAAIVRRALRRALPKNPELREFSIERVDLEFGYVLPRVFDQPEASALALHALLDELRPLLIELTGEVALRSLARIPELESWAAITQ